MEELIERAIRKHVYLADPDLYETFLKGLLSNRAFRDTRRTGAFPSLPNAEAILVDLSFLLRHKLFRRSKPQRCVLTGLVVFILLGRPQWTTTHGIRRFILFNTAGVAMYIQHIQRHLRLCYNLQRETEQRIWIPEPAEHMTPYTPVFRRVTDPAPCGDSSPGSEKTPAPDIFAPTSCDREIARARRSGKNVRVYMRTGQCLLNIDAFQETAERGTSGGSLVVYLLDPSAAVDETERELIERNRDRLDTLFGRQDSARVDYRSGFDDDFEFVQIGDESIFVRRVNDTIFTRFRRKHPLFTYFESYLLRPTRDLISPAR